MSLTMSRVFVSGSLSQNSLPVPVVEALHAIEQGGLQVLVGDALGVDLLVQRLLASDDYDNVTVYHITAAPRHFVRQSWKTVRVPVDTEDEAMTRGGHFTRAAQMVKDVAMARAADYGLVVWQDVRVNRFGNVEISKGSLNNIYNLLSEGKPLKLFLATHPEMGLFPLGSLSRFEELVMRKNVVDSRTLAYYKKTYPPKYTQDQFPIV